jgi:hypothetical protein
MNLIINETQYKELKKKLNELAPESSGVQDFLKLVKDTPGLLNHLGFSSHKALKEFVIDNYIKDFDELRGEADEFLKKKTKK